MSGHRTAHDLAKTDPHPDPGASGAIENIDHTPAIVELVSAAAETRTLPDPLRSGQILILTMKTDGGNITCTAATAINAAGNTIMTFADAGDTIMLVSIPDGASDYKWKVVGNEGTNVALS